MTYECVIRRRHRMGTEIAAVGPMVWVQEEKRHIFEWPIPDNFHPSPLLVVEIDVFEKEERVGHARCMRWLDAGQPFRVRFGNDEGDSDGGASEGDEPKPPSLKLDFDPDELLRTDAVCA